MGQLAFPQSTRIYLDTAPVIYSVEKHADYWETLQPVWKSFEDKQIEIVTGYLTLLEVLVQPIRENNEKLIATYESLLTRTDVILSPLTLDVLRTSARLRANHNLKTPDAIHAATAIESGCNFLISNDSTFKRLSDIQVIILSDHI